MNIENILEKERDNSYSVLRNKIGYRGEDFIEDIYCDARLKALKNIHTYDSSRPFKPWWYRILHNCLSDRLKKDKFELPTEFIEEKQISDHESINVRLTISELVKALDGLPAKQKDVLEKLINQELGGKSFKSDSSTRLILHKVRKKIQHLLN